MRFQPVHYVPPRRVQSDLSALQRNLLQVLGHKGSASLSEIMEALTEEAAQRTVQENLQALRQLDLAQLQGHGRGARWSLQLTLEVRAKYPGQRRRLGNERATALEGGLDG